MATHEEITASLNHFCTNCNQNERLKIMNRDWNRVILVRAEDITSEHTIVMENGQMNITTGAPAAANLTVSAGSEILADLFYGDITPAEPYMNGTLKVKGSEEDILRLDFITLMIWGE